MLGRNRNGIEALAASILAQSTKTLKAYGYPLDMPPVPIAEICMLRELSVNMRMNLHFRDLKLAGMLDARQKAIYCEAKDVLGRQHFSIAHELGHYEIHWRAMQSQAQFVDSEETFTRPFKSDTNSFEGSGVLFRVKGVPQIKSDPSMERDANYFAEFIMLPEFLLVEAIKEVKGLPYETAKHVLAHQFEVSDAAMDIRLKQLNLLVEFDYAYERRFFLDLNYQSDKTNDAPTKTNIIVTPQSRLRTWVTQVDRFSESVVSITLDLRTFHAADLNLFGVRQAIELVLLREHILQKFAVGHEATSSFVSCIFPDLSGHIVRHMGRLGLLPYFGLELSTGQYLVDPQAVVTGNHVLLKLTHIDNQANLDEIALHVGSALTEWVSKSQNSSGFAQLVRKTIFRLTQDIVFYGSVLSNCGSGYISVELENISTDGEVVGCRVFITVGDVGISLTQRLHSYRGLESASEFEAIEAYFLNDAERTALMNEITLHGGFIQVDTGDVQYHIGRGSNNFLTGLYQVPGLQISVVLDHTWKQAR